MVKIVNLLKKQSSNNHLIFKIQNKYLQQKLIQLAKSYKCDLNNIQKYLESESNNHSGCGLEPIL